MSLLKDFSIIALFIGAASLPAIANDRDSGQEVRLEVSSGTQATRLGPRFLVAVGSSGIPIGLPDQYNGSLAQQFRPNGPFHRRGVRLFWMQARVGFSDELPSNPIAYANMEVVPVTYEEARGLFSRMQIQLLPVEYRREASLGIEHRLSAYLIGYHFHSNSSDLDFEGQVQPMGRDTGLYVDFLVRGLGALYSRLLGVGEVPGVGIGRVELGLGMTDLPLVFQGQSGWIVRFELARGSLALDILADTQRGQAAFLLSYEVMARIAAGHRFQDGGELEVFVRGGVQGTLSGGLPAPNAAIPLGPTRGTENITPVVELGVGGRF